jgi:protein TonB
MLTRLIGSDRPRAKPLASSGVSLLFHAALGAAAVRAAVSDPPPPPLHAVETTLVYTAPPDVAGPRRIASAALPSIDRLFVDPILSAPLPDSPARLPPVAGGAPIDPRRFVVGPAGGGCPGCLAHASPVASVWTEAAVDRPVSIVACPAPEYPAALRVAGIDGRVVLEFVVDTLGSVEPASIRVLESTRRDFEASAAEAVRRCRFEPARIGNGPVRQLVRQGVTFRLAGELDYPSRSRCATAPIDR